MSDNTSRFATTDGDAVRSDAIVGGTAKVQVAKVGLGAAGLDQGLVTPGERLPVRARSAARELAEMYDEIRTGRDLLRRRARRRGAAAASGFVPPAAAAGGISIDPATLSLTSYYIATWSNPWLPQTSVGSSGTNGNLAPPGATPPPTDGITFPSNATAALFDGATNYLQTSTLAPSLVGLGAGAGGTIFALINCQSLSAPSANPYTDATIATDDAANFFVFTVTTAGVIAVVYTGSYVSTIGIPLPTGTWALATMTWDATNVYCYVNGVQAAPVAAVLASVGGSPIDVFGQGGGATYVNGDLAAFGTLDSFTPYATHAGMAGYFQNLYGISLGF